MRKKRQQSLVSKNAAISPEVLKIWEDRLEAEGLGVLERTTKIPSLYAARQQELYSAYRIYKNYGNLSQLNKLLLTYLILGYSIRFIAKRISFLGIPSKLIPKNPNNPRHKISSAHFFVFSRLNKLKDAAIKYRNTSRRSPELSSENYVVLSRLPK